MEIKILYGEEGVGKSTSCRKLLKVLVALSAQVLVYEEFEWGDFKATLLINGKRVSIYSAGDEKGHLRNAIEYGRTSKCAFLLCCERSYIHWKETIEGLKDWETYDWLTLKAYEEMNEKDIQQNKIVINLLNSII